MADSLEKKRAEFVDALARWHGGMDYAAPNPALRALRSYSHPNQEEQLILLRNELVRESEAAIVEVEALAKELRERANIGELIGPGWVSHQADRLAKEGEE